MTRDEGSLHRHGLARVRVAILLTALAVAMALALLFKETAYLFAAFMMLGPLLLLAAVVLLAWTILGELRAKQVL
jgi:hypothetical protein